MVFYTEELKLKILGFLLHAGLRSPSKLNELIFVTSSRIFNQREMK